MTLLRHAAGVTLRRHRDAVLLFALVALITVLNMAWVAQDLRPPHWDKAIHLTHSLTLLDGFSLQALPTWLLTYTFYPPVVYWVADLFYTALGRVDVWVAVLSQSIFLGVLVFATYGIGARLWSRRVGLLATVFVVTTPMLITGFKDYMLDGPLTAMSALALYLLIRSAGFTSRRYTLYFGAACALGILVKWTLVLVLGLPVVVATVLAVRAALRTGAWTPLANLAGAATIALALGGPWYVANLSPLARDAATFNSMSPQVKGDPAVASLPSAFWYAWNLFSNQLFLIPFLLFLAGVILLPRVKDSARRNLYPILLCVGTYVAFTLVYNKDPRYTMPMLPALAVIATYWFDAIAVRLGRALAFVTVLYGAITFLAMSFGSYVLPQEVFIALPPWPVVSEVYSFDARGHQLRVHGLRLWSQQGYPLGRPSAERWYQEEIFVRASQDGVGAVWSQLPSVDEIWFNGFAMQYFSTRYRIAWVASSANAGLVAIRTLAGASASPPAGFGEVASYSLPEGGGLRLYERRSAAAAAPLLLSLDELKGISTRVGHPVYWAGPIPDVRYEVTATSNGSVYVRYLPAGVAAGATDPYLTVATYPVPNAEAATRRAEAASGTVDVPLAGGVAFYDSLRPTNVYIAFAGSDFQIEIFDPAPDHLLFILGSGAISIVD